MAVWAYRNRRVAGRFTDTLAASSAFHLPLVTATRSYGVLAIRPEEDRPLALNERDLLESFAQQIAMVLEKEALRTSAEVARVSSKSDELQRALFNSVSHELQTPLTVMQSAVEELGRRPEPQLERLTEAMSEAMERLKRLVKNLLDSARLESGRLKLKREWGEVRDLVDQAIELVGLPLQGARLKVEVPADLPLVHLDFGLAAQALANVLHNAVVHSPVPARIEIEAERALEMILLRVTDSGPGIPPEMTETIFDRFVRAPQARPGGSGLGLAIAKGFLEAHGGSIEAHQAAAPGGAVFLIRLPLEMAPESARMKP